MAGAGRSRLPGSEEPGGRGRPTPGVVKRQRVGGDQTSSWLGEAVVTGDIERVQPDMNSAGTRLNDATENVRAAAQVVTTSRTAALALSHDAARKAVTAHMIAKGYRPKGGEGAHAAVYRYAEHQLVGVISAADRDALDELRRARGRAEYGDFAQDLVTEPDAVEAVALAGRVVVALKGDLAGRGNQGR